MGERTDPDFQKSVRIPPAAELAHRLQSVPLPLRKADVLNYFLRSVAGQAESGPTLVAAWEGACAEANQKFPRPVGQAITQLLHVYAFPFVLDAILADREIASAAKEELRILASTRA